MTSEPTYSDYKEALFTGIEIEGPNKGLKTLFVIGTVKVDLILKMAAKHKVEHIYLGAGGLSPFSKKDAYKICGKWNKVLTIESINLPIDIDFITGNVYWMMPVLWQNKPTYNLRGITTLPLSKNILVKIDTGFSVYVSPLSTFTKCLPEDYKKDEVIWVGE